MCEINSLPNECLEQIFLRLPLVAFIRVVPLVSRRWAAVRNAAARLCHRLELVIFDPEMSTFRCQPKFCQVIIHKHLPPEAVRSMAVLFTAIRHLHVWLPNPVLHPDTTTNPMPHLAPMIELWSKTLISLSVIIQNLGGGFNGPCINDPVLDVINTRLLRLRYLTFHDENFVHYGNDMKLDLPVLSRLHRFEFFTINPIEDLVDSLRRYACGNAQLTSVKIFNHITSKLVFDRLSEEVPPEVSVCAHVLGKNFPLSNMAFFILSS